MKPKLDLEQFRVDPVVPLQYTSQEDIRSPLVREIQGQPQPQYDEDFFEQFKVGDAELDSDTSALESGVRGLGQGATFGFEDEIRGAILGSYDALMEEEGLGDAYESRRDEIRQLNREAREANPKSYLAGELAGGIGTGIAAAPLTGGASLASGAGTVARTLGTQGAVTGLGYSEGEDIGEIATDTAIGGTLGATLGTGAAYATRGLGRAVQGRMSGVNETTKRLVSKLPGGVGAVKVGDMLRRKATQNAAKVLGGEQLRDLPEDELNMLGRVAIDRGVMRNPTTENIRKNIVKQNEIFNKELTDPTSKFGEVAEFGTYKFGKTRNAAQLTDEEISVLKSLGATNQEIANDPSLQGLGYYSQGRLNLRKRLFPEESVEREGIEKLSSVIGRLTSPRNLDSRKVGGKRVYDYNVNGKKIAEQMAKVGQEANFGNENPTRNEMAARYAYTELGNILNESISNAQFTVRRQLSDAVNLSDELRTGSPQSQVRYETVLENVSDVKDALNLHLDQLQELTGNVNLARATGSIESGTTNIVPRIDEGTVTQGISTIGGGVLGSLGGGQLTDDPTLQTMGTLAGAAIGAKAAPAVTRQFNTLATRGATEGLDRVGRALGGTATRTTPTQAPNFDKISDMVRKDPSKLGKYGQMLRQAMDKGSHNYAVAYQALFNQNQDFREMVRNQETEE